MKVYVLAYCNHGIVNERVLEAEEGQWLVVDGHTLGIPDSEGRIYKEDGKIYAVSNYRAVAYAAFLAELKRKRQEILRRAQYITDDIGVAMDMRDGVPPTLSE